MAQLNTTILLSQQVNVLLKQLRFSKRHVRLLTIPPQQPNNSTALLHPLLTHIIMPNNLLYNFSNRSSMIAFWLCLVKRSCKPLDSC